MGANFPTLSFTGTNRWLRQPFYLMRTLGEFDVASSLIEGDEKPSPLGKICRIIWGSCLLPRGQSTSQLHDYTIRWMNNSVHHVCCVLCYGRLKTERGGTLLLSKLKCTDGANTSTCGVI